MLRVSLPHFLKFIKIMPLARFRRALPPETYHVARIATARHEDCGTCLQMEIQLAKQAGVRVPLLHAVLDESPCSLPPELAEVYFFAEA
ncbi:MAG: carboxymuconolactone decarboxylase family protein, partial [Nitrospirae bacterium]|nr:carboxymuconolactone decarboxylase family protein [Nitrospirota bacterium]